MIARLIFERLFGMFNYNIQIDRNKNGITILTGPNGFGKSTILKTIIAINEGDLLFFKELNFYRLDIHFSDPQDLITIIKDDDSLLFDSEKVTFQMIDRYYKFGMHNKANISRDKLYSYIQQYTLREIYDENIDKDKEELISLYLNESSRSFNKNLKNVINIQNRLKSLLPNVYSIKEQRLIKEKADAIDTINVIESLPKKFISLISELLSRYSGISNELDSSYPNRLFNTEYGITKEEYDTKTDEMIEKFKKLNRYDISPMQKTITVGFKKEHEKALRIYFEDFNEKYSVFESFIHKLDLFTNIINERLTFKQIKISKDDGLIVIDNLANVLSLSQLSSGEKQEIVLFFDLIFITKENDLLLIDEPEISLHITWQKKFMSDLSNIINYKNLNAIIATHSPQIINNYWDSQIDLGELYGD